MHILAVAGLPEGMRSALGARLGVRAARAITDPPPRGSSASPPAAAP